MESVSIVGLNLFHLGVGKMTKTELLATAIIEMISMRDETQDTSTNVLDMILGLCNEVVDHE